MSSMMSRVVPASVLAIGVLLVNGIREQYAMPPRAPMKAIPAAYAGQHGTDLIVPDEERRVAGMTDYMMRAYGPDSAPTFTTYVGYYDRQVQGKAIHSPKNCLPGAGWEILNSERVAMPGGAPGETINRVLLANRGARALVYYWYQGRGRSESSEYKVKWNLLRDAAMHGRTEEALVRIVVPVGRSTASSSPDKDPEIARARQLADQIAPRLAADVRRVMPAPPGA